MAVFPRRRADDKELMNSNVFGLFKQYGFAGLQVGLVLIDVFKQKVLVSSRAVGLSGYDVVGFFMQEWRLGICVLK